MPSLRAFCRSEPSVRLVSFTIFATGVRAFECARSSLISVLVYLRTTDFFAFGVFFAFFATLCIPRFVSVRTTTHTLWRNLHPLNATPRQRATLRHAYAKLRCAIEDQRRFLGCILIPFRDQRA